jgi:hypothetical protein
MGTNFYVKLPIKVRKNIKERIIKLIESDDWEMAHDEIQKHVKIDENTVHIGKRSYGWKFLFDAHYAKYYDFNKKSITEFMKKGKLVDEYGEEYTPEKFWKSVSEFEDGEDAESYEQKYNKNSQPMMTTVTPDKVFEKYNPNRYGEFYGDGLRFTIFEDFA